MKVIRNVNETLKDDLALELQKGSMLSIVAADFSMYAFEALRKELSEIEELRFIFTDPTFIQKENSKKEKREFYIPKINRERRIYGTEFEVKLRNELNQKAIAKECAEWIKKKVTFKSNVGNKEITDRFIVLNDIAYYTVNSFTTVDLGCEQANNMGVNILKLESPASQAFIEQFAKLWQNEEELKDVTNNVISSISSAYNENAPEFIYFVTLYNIFHEFLTDISEDELPNERTGFKNSKIWNMLFNFQRDAALGIINKLEKYNGCILADSVGLGKTFTALAVIKYYEGRNKNVLVLCPKKLADNWNTYRANYKNNPIASDRLRYDVLYHSDLLRKRGYSGEIDLSRINWSNYDLVVIDESHNFRNGGAFDGEDKENRYTVLMNKVIREGVQTKVLMLSATPVNNRFNDLKNQLQLAYEGDSSKINDKLNTKNSIDDIFRNAQAAYNHWSKLPPAERTVQNLLENLSYDFFNLLDSVTIARSRKHITRYYDTKAIGSFPERKTPLSFRPALVKNGAVNYKEIFSKLDELELSIYTPTEFILHSRLPKYAELFDDNKVNTGFTQANRERGIRRLMAINILKRMESSVYSFRLTVERVRASICAALQKIDSFTQHRLANAQVDTGTDFSGADFDMEEESFVVGKKVPIELADMDIVGWGHSLQHDKECLDELLGMVQSITPVQDNKLQELLELIDDKIQHPLNADNKKIIVFTAFADTAAYLYEHVSKHVQEQFGLHTAMVTGSVDGRCTIPKLRCDLNTVLTCFAPLAKDKKLLFPEDKNEIDILIATDCISEGQNLQDCDYLVNYDIHWNPVRIIQRFGRIDRIGSKNAYIQLVNFWPDVDLDEYIDLKSRVESRMKAVDLTATADDNLLSNNEKLDLQYRKQQLKQLQKEVVDIEDMGTGISIMDLGLNEFRLDLLEYIKTHGELDKTPFGLHAVVPASEECPPGVIYVLKNCTDNINIDRKNLLHPFYAVYIGEDGEIICNHLAPKKLLDKLRFTCRGKDKPLTDVCSDFNKATNDGRSMGIYSQLLEDAIASIINVKDADDVDSFLSGEEISFFDNSIKGLDDFELICFLVVRGEQ